MDMNKIKTGRLTVIGAGISGIALALFARKRGAKVFVSEERGTLEADALEQLKNAGIEWESGGHTERAFEAETLLLSSGIPPFASCVKEAERRGLPVTGELDFVMPHIEGRIIGITGSNGKSTLTSLSGHIFQRSGFKTAVGGNIGTPLPLFTDESYDYAVLELSSFQLHWASNLKSDIAVVTNLAPDHLDWHGTYEAYVASKAKILSLQGGAGWGIVQDRDYRGACADNDSLDPFGVTNPEKIIALSWLDRLKSEAKNQIFMEKDRAVLRLGQTERNLFQYSDTSLLGSHNLENIAMALTAAYLLNAWPAEKIKTILDGFQPLPHRCELAGTINGVIYVDDSKGTNVAASVAAMTSIKGRKIVILGGKGKGEDYALLAEAVKREAEAAVLIGEEKGRIEAALKNTGFNTVHKTASMEEAVKTAGALAKPGMTVLLSPACTSWDMYENYKKRGEHFCAIVRNMVN